MKELETLLEKFWIIKDEDKDLYYSIKDASSKIKDFVEEKLGYKLIITPYLIKLEKLPGKSEAWMGIADFDDKMEYAFLCLVLIFLEDKVDGEQFVLSQITDFVETAYEGMEKVDWTLFIHRKRMVKVLKFVVSIGMINVDDGDESRFMDSIETEVLYRSTGLSRYFMRNFTGNLLNYETLEDIENGEWLDMDRDRGRVRRNRVYRRLIMSPAIYQEKADDADYLYIKSCRGMLQKDIEDILDSQLHIHKNGAFIVLNQNKHFKSTFPENNTISGIVLQINYTICEKLKAKELQKNNEDIITVSVTAFQRIIQDVKENCQAGWSKEYREMPLIRLFEEVMEYMKGFNMIEICEEAYGAREINIMPIVGKITGQYPKNFKIKLDEESMVTEVG